MSGLVVDFKSSSQIVKEEKDRAEAAEAQNTEYTFQTNLASHIRKVWTTNRWAKQEVYRRLLSCLRARKGEYSDSERTAITSMGGADPIYLKLTGTKARAAAAWVRDILLPVKDRPWELDPTPIPDLPEDIKEATMKSVLMQIQQMAQQDGLQLTPDQMLQFTDMVKSKVLEQLTVVAEIAVKNIERKIEDLMIDGQYKKAMEEFIEDFVTYPFAVLKGPYYQTKIYLEWKKGKPVPTEQNVLCWRRVSPFDIYYSPFASHIQDGDLIERIRYSRTQLYQLKGMDGYKGSEIDGVLQKHGEGGLKDWIWEDYERDLLEKNSQLVNGDQYDVIDGLHFWGEAKGEDLINWGYDPKKIKDPLKMYPVDAILIDRWVVRAVINDNPMRHRPYHSACWDAIPGSIVGVALSEQMEDHQKMVNATARALATNMSIGSGPQVAILTDMMAAGEEITSIYPMKIWQMKSSITGNSGKPIEFFQPEIKAQELLAVLNQFEQKADDVTNVPRYSYGNEKIGGAGSTATGLSMLMNSAAKGIRRAIANIDLNVIQPTVYQTFIEIMTTDPDPTIRGDVKVVATGSAAVLIKEQTQENQKEFLQITSNPIDIEIMGKKGRARLLADIANNLNINPLVLPSDEELDAQEKQEREMMMQQQQAEIAATQGAGAEQQAATEQQVEALKQAEAQIELKDKIVQKQASDVQTEIKKLKQLQAKIEDQMAQLALQKIELDKENAKRLADIEKAKLNLQSQAENFKIQQDRDQMKRLADIERAKLDLQVEAETIKAKQDTNQSHRLAEIDKAMLTLEMEGEKLKALGQKVKMISATKEEETEKDGKDSEKKESKSASDATSKAVAQALSQVAEAMKSLSGPKKISIGDIKRDSEGKIEGASATSKPTSVGNKSE